MKASQMFPKQYIAAEDLGDKCFNATITGFGPVAEFDDGDRPVLMFREYKKGLVLKPSIVSVLIWLHGDETDGWMGKQVQLYNELVTFRGKTAPAVRVRGINSVMGYGAEAAVEPGAPLQPDNGQGMGPGEQAAQQARETVGQPMPTDVMDDEVPF